MKKFEPLKGFPIIDTNRVEKAEAEISRSLTSVRVMKLADRNRFVLRVADGSCHVHSLASFWE